MVPDGAGARHRRHALVQRHQGAPHEAAARGGTLPRSLTVAAPTLTEAGGARGWAHTAAPRAGAQVVPYLCAAAARRLEQDQQLARTTREELQTAAATFW